ncbi:bifunctional demethylmenaquinone methyltransferase/2-methoxy-6-polyprenyl-1,4-benzoquinol methylase UbiE [Synechocystis sp. LEGE 06083]|uniref:bifunctional demethylmenaquinone methyltransferase/2-methoxy-6-polyprenyl-1,4-benzoquinol methylase UbiE n=1 Tax=Synechocystis sp. LEGE 06083 TaxID=915336 RepID=UPI001880F8B0|nr:bifunctional demethylmenaquinone methyltransferase/2-methoxy-6-polyprenyl-1,4-benzoquinol methylase UbiE [Synechocystis sp. LEGE 06083]MBE9196207.1 bifunctional demethylmenaquinone methyltransferase/2-methoxy-6-polyprenyl-1,4-benzoquinol methylase UbiE [Synechocystis sp. LEGE 06083]
MNSSRLPQPAAQDVQKIFARIAPQYDDLNTFLSFGQHHIWKAMAVKWSGVLPGDLLLDVCCGSGDLAFQGAKVVGTEGKVIGLDFCAELLAIAAGKHQSKYAQLPMQWLQGDALALPFGDREFDGATMGYGLRNVGNIPQALGELQRVLKPGKKVAILDFHQPSNALVASFQRWYLANVVVPMAKQWRLTEEYAYLQPSLDRFPTGPAQVKLALEAGFAKAIHYPIAAGLMGVLVAQKGPIS